MELDKALPYLHEAESACNSITKKERVKLERLRMLANSKSWSCFAGI